MFLKEFILSLGAILFMLGCGSDVKPTTRPVADKDIIGTWVYPLVYRDEGNVRLSLKSDGTFEQQFSHRTLGKVVEKGHWRIEQSHLSLEPFWTTANDNRGFDRRESVTWWIIDSPGNQFALFGADAEDGDEWQPIYKAK